MKSITGTESGLCPKQHNKLLKVLKACFECNLSRHKGLEWANVQARLEAKPDKLWPLAEMKRTGGEPDVVGVKSGEFVFMDYAPENPAWRRSVCYDRKKLDVPTRHGAIPPCGTGAASSRRIPNPSNSRGLVIVANSPQLDVSRAVGRTDELRFESRRIRRD